MSYCFNSEYNRQEQLAALQSSQLMMKQDIPTRSKSQRFLRSLCFPILLICKQVGVAPFHDEFHPFRLNWPITDQAEQPQHDVDLNSSAISNQIAKNNPADQWLSLITRLSTSILIVLLLLFKGLINNGDIPPFLTRILPRRTPNCKTNAQDEADTRYYASAFGSWAYDPTPSLPPSLLFPSPGLSFCWPFLTFLKKW